MNVQELSEAIFTVNKHAKTAQNPKFLYQLKGASLEKMISMGIAKKIGLHFSNNPKNVQQTSSVLVECGSYQFHINPAKEDFKTLTHLGLAIEGFRNPPSKMNLRTAKSILQKYTGIKETIPSATRKYVQPVFTRLGETPQSIQKRPKKE